VVSSRPHDPEAFTQGLVLDQGTLYESTGLYGRSSLRQVDPADGRVLRKVDVPARYFAEGLALVGERLVQLTWQEHVALVYKRATFDRSGDLPYQGEGWGLCYDGQSLVMSDGSDHLTFRDPETFAVRRTVPVRLGANAVNQLNELECAQGKIYANVWQTEEIVEVDPATGKVEAVIDASGLLAPQEKNGADVLNGIAYDPQAGTFLITGKLWPKLFEVRFVPPGS
jgi:glutamine cyclotransferase